MTPVHLAEMPQTLPAAGQSLLETQLRIAVISAPRSGNTWLRNMLANVYSLSEISHHMPEHCDWAALPGRVAFQIHWDPVEPFLGLMRRYGFQVVTVARHPLDLFLSLLNLRQYTDVSPHWDESNGGAGTLVGATPRSEAFLDFACGPMAASLLSPTLEWLRMPGTVGVRYEDLVADTLGTLSQVTQAVSPDLRRSPADVAPDHTMDRARAGYGVWHYHYWQGKPGHWKTLLTPREAHRIADAHAGAFAQLGYTCDPDPDLDDAQADLNWYRIQHDSIRKHLADERSKHQVTRSNFQSELAQRATAEATLAAAQSQAETALQALEVLREKHADRRKALAKARTRLNLARQRLLEVESLGPYSIQLARTMQNLSRQHPRLASAVKQLIGPRQKSA
jgi:hypothetical protein